MGSVRTLGLLGMAAVTVCLAGSPRAAASDTGFTIRTRVMHAPSRIDWSVPPAGEWDVAVGYDAARCEVYCAYRLKRDEFGRPRLTGLLVPPVASIKVYWDSAAAPEDITVDPGGLEQPGIASRAAPQVETVYLPGRRLAARVPPDSSSETAPAEVPVISVSVAAPATLEISASLPLRI